MELSTYIPRRIDGLSDDAQAKFKNLLDVFDKHASANKTKERYYEGRVTLGEVFFPISVISQAGGIRMGIIDYGTIGCNPGQSETI